MKLTKFAHSCVLVETESRTALFDPGVFSWESGVVHVDTFPEIHDVIITHEHADHYNEDFIKAVFAHSPNAQWITNKSIANKLKDLGISDIRTESTESCKIINIPHEPVEPFAITVDHIAVEWMDVLTHPGDTLEFTSTKPLLHLPMTAPWGKTVESLKKALELKPKFVLPIHDWMLRDEWKTIVYDRFETACQEKGITFLKAVDGQPIEIDL